MSKKLRELTEDEIVELKNIWLLIKSGRAPDKEVKAKAIKFWNNIAGTNYTSTTSCSACLGTVFYGLEGLYKEYFNNDI